MARWNGTAITFPVGLDTLKANAICGGELAAQTGALLAPTTEWAVGGVPFPYTLRFDLPLIEELMRKLFEQLGAMGFRVILAITGHYGLEQTLALNAPRWTVCKIRRRLFLRAENTKW